MLGEVLGAERDELRDDVSLFAVGLTSTSAVVLASELESRLGVSFPVTLAFDYPTTSQLCSYVTAMLGACGNNCQSPPSDRHPMLGRVLALVSEILLLDDCIPLDQEGSLWDAGLTSLSAIALSSKLQDALGVNMPATLAFDYPSIHAIAEYLSERLPGVELVESPPSIVSTGTFPASPPTSTDVLLITSFDVSVPSPGDGGAGHPEWSMVAASDVVRPVPLTRWALDENETSELEVRLSGMLADVELFDAPLFCMARGEAVLLDPQQRLLLQQTHGALAEQSHSASARCAVFVGISTMEYAMHVAHETSAFAATGNAHSVAAGRISYLYGLQGPSVSVDTACSSSLVAVHMLVNCLQLTAEADSGIAAAVNLALRREPFLMFLRAGMITLDGRCKTLDAAADGYGRLEACGSLFVVRSRAFPKALGLVHLVGSAVNQDGRSSSLTAPNGPSQQRLLRTALAFGKVSGLDVNCL